MSNHKDNVVNQKFCEVYELLRERKLVKNKSDIADKLGTYNHIINSIINGKRSITIEQLNKLFHYYDVNANYIFGLSDIVFATTDDEYDLPSLHKNDIYTNERSNIRLLPHKALAGNAIDNPADLEREEGTWFSLPNYNGDLTAIEIDGDSMMPTLMNGDLVVCEYVERGNSIMENNVYVIVTDVVVAKRVQQIKENGTLMGLRLISDNDAVYKPYDIALEDINALLKVKCRLTSYGVG